MPKNSLGNGLQRKQRKRGLNALSRLPQPSSFSQASILLPLFGTAEPASFQNAVPASPNPSSSSIDSFLVLLHPLNTPSSSIFPWPARLKRLEVRIAICLYSFRGTDTDWEIWRDACFADGGGHGCTGREGCDGKGWR